MLPKDKQINILADFSLLARFLLVMPDPVVALLSDGQLVQVVRPSVVAVSSPSVRLRRVSSTQCFVDSSDDCTLSFKASLSNVG